MAFEVLTFDIVNFRFTFTAERRPATKSSYCVTTNSRTRTLSKLPKAPTALPLVHPVRVKYLAAGTRTILLFQPSI